MSAPVAKPLSVDDFLAWERRQAARYEFDGARIAAMTGGTLEHSTIATNLVEALRRRLQPPRRAFRGDVKILAAGSVRYPDAVVSCAMAERGADIVPDPVVVFEVLSASTASVDRVTKNEEYRATSSIQRYVMLEQTRIAATVFARRADRWIGTIVTGDAMLDMPEIAVALPLAELYTDVDLPPPDTDD